MKIKFLGTAAAEGFPAVFCNCEACRRAKKLGGKNIRTRSQILINNDLLVDFPPDTYAHVLSHNVDLSAVKHVLFTHSHPDHCQPTDLIYREKPYAHNMTQYNLSVYGSETVINFIKSRIADHLTDSAAKTLRFFTVKPYQTFNADGYEITAMPAEHTKGEDCFIYLIKQCGKTYLQFNDSGILPDSVYDFLRDRGEKIDAVSFDCTYGYARKGQGRHMGVLDNADERERLLSRGLVRKNTQYIITHFSHNCNLTHSELEEKTAALNFITAYDGMETEI